MNYFNISRATQGLIAYLKEHLRRQRPGRPQLCIAHDTRHFSRPFAELCAKVATENGCDAFALRGAALDPGTLLRRASHGLGCRHRPHRQPQSRRTTTASNVYFSDGAQVVEPHASGIIAKVNAIESRRLRARARSGARPPASARRGTRRGLHGDGSRRSSSIRPMVARRSSPAHRLHAHPRHGRRHHQAHAPASRFPGHPPSRSRMPSTAAFPPSNLQTRRMPRP